MASTLPQATTLFWDLNSKFPPDRQRSCSVIGLEGNRVTLDIGRAQAVAKNAIYDIYTRRTYLIFQAQVIDTTDFTATAELVRHGESIPNTFVEVDDFAILRTWALPERTVVKFHSSRDDLRGWLKSDLEQIPNLVLDEENSPNAHLEVKINEQYGFDIWQQDKRLERLPIVHLEPDERQAIAKLAQVLRHVTRFQAIQSMSCQAPGGHVQDGHFEFILEKNGNKLTHTDSKRFRVGDKEEGLGVRLRYTGSFEPAWVSIIEFGMSWGVSIIYESILLKGALEPPETFEPTKCTWKLAEKGREDDSNGGIDRWVVYISEGKSRPGWSDMLLPQLPVHGSSLPVDSLIHRPPEVKGVTTRSAPMNARMDAPNPRGWGVVEYEFQVD
ncbi:hypothetical protein O1611_g3433 [Lasiodiplodia mahajangana]|uniref:Uncharacterized protein n=1 Tax=Lasiodiplodia mahajangana TaxID=1108764 RepID=A0ACC2JSF4_9PEZI|nr:hypothetical protein O1611_g3433 [Lasiodiplodia mahajangana]